MTIYYFEDTNRVEYRHVLKHGEYISKEKLESMTIIEIAEFLS